MRRLRDSKCFPLQILRRDYGRKPLNYLRRYLASYLRRYEGSYLLVYSFYVDTINCKNVTRTWCFVNQNHGLSVSYNDDMTWYLQP